MRRFNNSNAHRCYSWAIATRYSVMRQIVIRRPAALSVTMEPFISHSFALNSAWNEFQQKALQIV